MRLLVPGFSINAKENKLFELAEYYRLPLITLSSLVSNAVTSQTNLGKQVRVCLESGTLISNALALQLLEERLTEPDMEDGWVLSGFPCNMTQAAMLNVMLLGIGQPYDVVIHIKSINPERTTSLIGDQLIYPSCLSANAVLKIPLARFYNRLNKFVTISSDMSLAAIDSLLKSFGVGLAKS